MIRKVLFFLFFSVLILNLANWEAKIIFAQKEFATDVSVFYKFEDSGMAEVTHKISLENLFSNMYATSYSLVLDNVEPLNVIAKEGEKNLKLSSKKDGSKTILEVNFEDIVVGKSKTRNFEISFQNSSFAQKTGEVWEISLPRLSEDSPFRTYNTAISIPFSFGNEAYISPKPEEIEKIEGRNVYIFGKETFSKTGVVAGFGSFQVFSFRLNYHLENPLNKTASTEIALPPDTALQKVYYQSIIPTPLNVSVDNDGNWIALYTLKPRERIDIEALGTVQIFSGPRPFPKSSTEELNKNLFESEFWQVNDPQIKALAEKLKTPREIYNYVVKNLSYDYDRVKPNISRLGAKGALNNPKQAICMEFTDLFIALARSAGIPAREINGFAYTENPKVKPLSLVNDVLHSWPEYWDKEKMAWIPVDPTWGTTTQGIDFFSKLDLRHFTFVIHGQNTQFPFPPGSYKLGPNPQKDVFVSFGQLPEDRQGHTEIFLQSNNFIDYLTNNIEVQVKNIGPAALYNLSPEIYFDQKLFRTENISILPPFAVFHTNINVPFSFLGRKTPAVVKVSTSDQEVEITTFKNMVIISSLLGLFIVFSLIIVLILTRIKRLHLFNFDFTPKFLKTIYKKILKKLPIKNLTFIPSSTDTRIE